MVRNGFPLEYRNDGVGYDWPGHINDTRPSLTSTVKLLILDSLGTFGPELPTGSGNLIPPLSLPESWRWVSLSWTCQPYSGAPGILNFYLQNFWELWRSSRHRF